MLYQVSSWEGGLPHGVFLRSFVPISPGELDMVASLCYNSPSCVPPPKAYAADRWLANTRTYSSTHSLLA
jgi:hypothetical protein